MTKANELLDVIDEADYGHLTKNVEDYVKAEIKKRKLLAPSKQAKKLVSDTMSKFGLTDAPSHNTILAMATGRGNDVAKLNKDDK